MGNNDEFVAGVLYRHHLEQEIEWRNELPPDSDIAVIGELIENINSLGYNIKYYTNLTSRGIQDIAILPFVKELLPKLRDK